jgi:hypothetical protein
LREAGIPLDHRVADLGVGKIGGGDQRLAMIAAVGDDGGDGVLHPLGDAMGAEIVEQQQLGV